MNASRVSFIRRFIIYPWLSDALHFDITDKYLPLRFGLVAGALCVIYGLGVCHCFLTPAAAKSWLFKCRRVRNGPIIHEFQTDP